MYLRSVRTPASLVRKARCPPGLLSREDSRRRSTVRKAVGGKRLQLPHKTRGSCPSRIYRPQAEPGENSAPSQRDEESVPLDEEVAMSSVTGSEEWRMRPMTIALPEHARTAESWLVLATFLKIIQVGVYGKGLLTMIAAGSIMLAVIKQILQRKLHEKRFFPLIAILCSILALYIFRRLGV